MKRLATAALFAVIAVPLAGRQTAAPTPAPDIQTLGPQVGSTVPSFTLPDQAGQTRSLEDLMGPKGAILVFFRSADW